MSRAEKMSKLEQLLLSAMDEGYTIKFEYINTTDYVRITVTYREVNYVQCIHRSDFRIADLYSILCTMLDSVKYRWMFEHENK